MARKDYYDDPDAPAPNSIVAAASAIVTNNESAILVHRRTDNDLWALPGGGMEFGESISDTVVREVREETGLRVAVKYVVAVYSDPKHVFAYTDGEVRQEFSICVACETIGGELKISDESKELKFVHPRDIDQLTMHPRIRARVTDYLNQICGGLNPGWEKPNS
jgi:ADP-ribose pyrophosphatase YjhB (NUDIX family)